MLGGLAWLEIQSLGAGQSTGGLVVDVRPSLLRLLVKDSVFIRKD